MHKVAFKWRKCQEQCNFKIRSTYEHSLTHSRFIDMILWYFHSMKSWQINCCWPSIQFTEFSCIVFLYVLISKTESFSTDGVCVSVGALLTGLVMHTWTLSDMWWFCVKKWCVNSQLHTLWMKPLDTCGLVCVVVILGSNFRSFFCLCCEKKAKQKSHFVAHMLNLSKSTF